MTPIYDDDVRDPASIGAILAQIIEAKLEKQENISKSSYAAGSAPSLHNPVGPYIHFLCTYSAALRSRESYSDRKIGRAFAYVSMTFNNEIDFLNVGPSPVDII
jgi:hypothetical protein